MQNVAQPTEPVNGRLLAALEAMRLRNVTACPAEQIRIDRGLALARAGHVQLQSDGTASVLSGTFPDTWYRVNGRCPCRDASVAPGQRCKHRWGMQLLKKAEAYLLQQIDRPLDDAPPYAFPTWFSTWQATYWLNGEPVNGIARKRADGHFDFTPDGMARSVILPYACLALGPGLTERAGMDDMVPSVEEAA